MMLASSNIAGYAYPLATKFVFLLLATLTIARADLVTWSRCKEEEFGTRGRPLEERPDVSAVVLRLTSCGIHRLNLGDFKGLPNLKSIYIIGNFIEDIDPAVFSPVSQVTSLFLSYNKLREVPIVGYRSLFPRLKILHVEYNFITKIENSRTFSVCVQLETLLLNDNLIDHIHPDVFSPLINLETLRLDNNRLTKLSSGLFFNINSLNDINLSNNLIDYVAPRALGSNVKYIDLSNNLIDYLAPGAFGRNMSYLNLQRNKIAFLPSQFAGNFAPYTPLKGQSGILFAYNNWDCSCLLELIADLNRLDVLYVRSYYEGIEKSCVFSGRHACHRDAPTGLLSTPRRISHFTSNAN